MADWFLGVREAPHDQIYWAKHQIAVVEALAAGVDERTEHMSGCYSLSSEVGLTEGVMLRLLEGPLAFGWVSEA